MKSVSNSKTYFFMEDESGNLTFVARYNITEGGKMSDGKFEMTLPPGIMTTIKQFINKDVIPQINIQEKIGG